MSFTIFILGFHIYTLEELKETSNVKFLAPDIELGRSYYFYHIQTFKGNAHVFF